MDVESEPDSSVKNFWLGKLYNDNPIHEIMNRSSTISASLFKPQRNSCNRCDQSVLTHFQAEQTYGLSASPSGLCV